MILLVNTFATFAPVSQSSGLASRIFAIWFMYVKRLESRYSCRTFLTPPIFLFLSSILLSGLAFLSSFSYTTGDVPHALVLALGQFAIFVHQFTREVTRCLSSLSRVSRSYLFFTFHRTTTINTLLGGLHSHSELSAFGPWHIARG